MKIWKTFSAEHSAKLRIIGTFKDENSVEKVKEIIEAMLDVDTNEEPKRGDYYTDTVMDVLKKYNLPPINPEDVKHFNHLHSIDYSDRQIEIRTDELEIQGLVNLMISKGAKVEMYSRHDYPNG